MIISVDTEELSRMASMALNANSEIENSASRLSLVVEHNDWNCKERDRINENITTIKSSHQKLTEDMAEFSAALNKIAAVFSEAEQSLPNEFQHIDTMIGSALSLTGSAVSSGAVTAASVNSLAESTVINSSLQSYEFSNLNNGINICSFDSFLTNDTNA